MLWGEKSDKKLEIYSNNRQFRIQVTHSLTHTHTHTHNTPWDFPFDYDVMMTNMVEEK